MGWDGGKTFTLEDFNPSEDLALDSWSPSWHWRQHGTWHLLGQLGAGSYWQLMEATASFWERRSSRNSSSLLFPSLEVHNWRYWRALSDKLGLEYRKETPDNLWAKWSTLLSFFTPSCPITNSNPSDQSGKMMQQGPLSLKGGHRWLF